MGFHAVILCVSILFGDSRYVHWGIGHWFVRSIGMRSVPVRQEEEHVQCVFYNETTMSSTRFDSITNDAARRGTGTLLTLSWSWPRPDCP